MILLGLGSTPVKASTLLLDPPHSLAAQSVSQPLLPSLESGSLFYKEDQTHKRNHAVNRDGWGVGYYGENRALHRERSGDPAATAVDVAVPSGQQAFKSVVGEVYFEVDPVLFQLMDVESTGIFAHIRAATDGDLNPENSHPFAFNQLLWMHNGGIPQKVCNPTKDVFTGQVVLSSQASPPSISLPRKNYWTTSVVSVQKS